MRGTDRREAANRARRRCAERTTRGSANARGVRDATVEPVGRSGDVSCGRRALREKEPTYVAGARWRGSPGSSWNRVEKSPPSVNPKNCLLIASAGMGRQLNSISIERRIFRSVGPVAAPQRIFLLLPRPGIWRASPPRARLASVVGARARGSVRGTMAGEHRIGGRTPNRRARRRGWPPKRVRPSTRPERHSAFPRSGRVVRGPCPSRRRVPRPCPLSSTPQNAGSSP